MKFTLNQAAEQTGKSKSVISNAIKSGKLSADKVKNPKTNKYNYSIDAAELFRVYERVEQPKNAEKNKSEHPLSSLTPEQTAYVKYRELKAQLENERRRNSDLEEQNQQLQKNLQQAMQINLITAQKKEDKKFTFFGIPIFGK